MQLKLIDWDLIQRLYLAHLAWGCRIARPTTNCADAKAHRKTLVYQKLGLVRRGNVRWLGVSKVYL